jgi:hypothetical protein
LKFFLFTTPQVNVKIYERLILRRSLLLKKLAAFACSPVLGYIGSYGM